MYQRMEERAELRHLVDRGASILMLAPRRVGKTWLMNKLADDLRTSGWNAVVCDAQGFSEEEQLYRHLCEKISDLKSPVKRGMSLLQRRLTNITTGGNWTSWPQVLGSMNWKDYLNQLVTDLNNSQSKTLILLDEYSLFVAARLKKSPETVLEMLHYFRNLKQNFPNVRWMLTGSIGLDALARQNGIGGALLGYETFPVHPFSRQAAKEYIIDLNKNGEIFRRFELSEQAFDYLFDELGWLSPYYLEHIAKNIRGTGAATKNGETQAEIIDVEEAFKKLLSPDFRNYFVALEEHIEKNFNSEVQDKLFTILEVCAQRQQGVQVGSIEAMLIEKHPSLNKRDVHLLLDILVSDGFIVLTDDGARYVFRSGLVRRYWDRYHCSKH